VYLVGDEWKETTSPYPAYTSAEELKNLITQGDIRLEKHHILIKGSRSNRLEQLIEVL
jgi:UDP-N-acetylmuramyl pentapeptide synthase